MFFKRSRYAKVSEHTIVDKNGRVIRYKATRFTPDTPTALVGHLVTNDERLDHIAWQHYRDAERYWRICDANRGLWPDDLLEEAAILRIPPSEE